jgi:hypothetical protein
VTEGRAAAPGTDASPGAVAVQKTCPSSSCHEGALLLGVMTAGGRLAYLHPPTPVDTRFVTREVSRGSPERRFRFAAPCIEGGCPQWTGEGCAIADMAGEAVDLGMPGSPRHLPACSIRHSCRWYSQQGAAACAVCPFIVADMGGTATYSSAQHD